jgi:hypothetical protein
MKKASESCKESSKIEDITSVAPVIELGYFYVPDKVFVVIQIQTEVVPRL